MPFSVVLNTSVVLCGLIFNYKKETASAQKDSGYDSGENIP
jgi:hypothetical protein